MIDPISAITMATSAYNVVTRMVAAGREFEDTAQQLGKWYSAVNDFRFAKEQAKQLRTMLMFRYGANAWDELISMRRKIAKQRQETVYRQAELRKDLLNTAAILLLIFACIGVFGGLGYLIMDSKGLI
jgi:hypothetical protein